MSIPTLLLKHSTTTCPDVLFIKWDCLWESPSPYSAHCNTSASRQQCIGPRHHVCINNVRRSAICFCLSAAAEAFPDAGNCSPGGRLDVMTLKISGSFFRVADPGARAQRRHTRCDNAHRTHTLHSSEMPGSEAKTHSLLILLIRVLIFCRSFRSHLPSFPDR